MTRMGHSTSGPARSNILVQLIRKDLYLSRWFCVGSLLVGLVALGLLAGGGGTRLYMGGVLMATVLIAHGAIVVAFSVLEERQRKTLPFLLSLPVSVEQYAAAKILANVLSFGMVWIFLLLGTLAIVLSRDDLPNGLVAYLLIALGEIFVSTCVILAVAMATESLPLTLATMMVGNLVFNGFSFQIPRLSSFAAAAESPEIVWPPQALSLLLMEWVAIVMVLAAAYVLSVRRRDIL